MPVIVLAALATIGRMLTMPLPNFQPSTALIILAGIYFGRNSGLMCGLLVAFVSNLFLGQGTWTLWQMLAWGGLGYCAGAFFHRGLHRDPHRVPHREFGKHPLGKSSKFFAGISSKWRRLIPVLVFGVIASFAYGAIMDFQFWISFTWESGIPGLATAFIAGFPMNALHAVSTVVFLALIYLPWGKKLERLRTKYDLRGF
jgi:energy-coupling factor transport system substrate-specific component